MQTLAVLQLQQWSHLLLLTLVCVLAGTAGRAESQPLPKRAREAASQSDLHRLVSAHSRGEAVVMTSEGDALGHPEQVQVCDLLKMWLRSGALLA